MQARNLCMQMANLRLYRGQPLLYAAEVIFHLPDIRPVSAQMLKNQVFKVFSHDVLS